MSGVNNATNTEVSGDGLASNGAVNPRIEPGLGLGNFADAVEAAEAAFERKLEELLRKENLQDLPEENKQGIKSLLKLQRSLGGNHQLDTRLLTAAMRQPVMYSPAQMTIRQFLCGYEAFVNVLGLSEAAIIGGFVTYLPPKMQERIVESDLDTSSWASYKEGARKILEDSSRYNALKARFDIRNTSQKAGESVYEFGERLRDLGNIGFPNTDPTARSSRDSVMKDALAAGIINDEVSIQLIRNINDMSFNRLLEEAITLEISHQARNTIRRRDVAVEVPVLRTEFSQANRSGPSRQFEEHTPNRSDYQYQTNMYDDDRTPRWVCSDCWEQNSREFNSE
eukprot:sb/3466473/